MSFLKKSFAVITAALLTSFGIFFANDTEPSVGADAALAKLKAGNERFVKSDISAGKPNAERRAATAKAQHPYAVVVTCADSRTSPELIFDENIGDLFVVRTAGNLVDDYELGSIEYAVEHLGTRLIVVLGHERCGAVDAAVQSATAPGHIGAIVRDIQPAVEAAKAEGGDILLKAINKNVARVAAKIRSEGKFGEAASEVKVVKGRYSLDTGKVAWLEE